MRLKHTVLVMALGYTALIAEGASNLNAQEFGKEVEGGNAALKEFTFDSQDYELYSYELTQQIEAIGAELGINEPTAQAPEESSELTISKGDTNDKEVN